MAVSPCTAWCAAYARASTRHANIRSLWSAIIAQRRLARAYEGLPCLRQCVQHNRSKWAQRTSSPETAASRVTPLPSLELGNHLVGEEPHGRHHHVARHRCRPIDLEHNLVCAKVLPQHL